LIAGLVFPGIFFNDYLIEEDVNNDYENGKGLVKSVMFYEAILASLLLLPGFFFIRDKPPNPPSITANMPRMDAKKSLKMLLTDKCSILVIICNMLFFGSFKSLSVLISFLFTPFGFSSG